MSAGMENNRVTKETHSERLSSLPITTGISTWAPSEPLYVWASSALPNKGIDEEGPGSHVVHSSKSTSFLLRFG